MGQSLSSVKIHYVFATDHRTPWLTDDMRVRLFAYMGGIAAERKCPLLAAGGMPDHVHLLMVLHPTMPLADLARDLKANSSRWIHETFPDKREFAWQDGYGVFGVSESAVEDVKAYLANQAEHHRVRTFQEEYIRFLEKNRVPFDPRYLWT